MMMKARLRGMLMTYLQRKSVADSLGGAVVASGGPQAHAEGAGP